MVFDIGFVNSEGAKAPEEAMKLFTRLLVVLLVVLGLAGTAFAQEPVISGQIVDLNGNQIVDMRALLVPMSWDYGTDDFVQGSPVMDIKSCYQLIDSLSINKWLVSQGKQKRPGLIPARLNASHNR